MFEETELVYEAALEAARHGEAAALATVLEARGSTPRSASAKMLVYADGRTVGTIGGGGVESRVIEEAISAIAEGESRELHYRLVDEEEGDPGICGGDMRIFVDVMVPRPVVLIIGAGHLGQAVAELADFLGYRIAVLDERQELVTPDRFPWARTFLTGDVAEQVREFGVDAHTYVVVVTPHHSLDEQVLSAVADRSFGYIGRIGSQRRTAHTFGRAREAGVPDEVLDRVNTPIGLDIGAETPREIAVSILAEIIAVERAGDKERVDRDQ
ncbi:MAG: XdhC/CoxI family protein [Anaerolineae bacterium]|jgi:xanthine dehydrogenase accessory factor